MNTVRTSDTLPALTEAERKALAESVATFGVLVPIVQAEDGEILDGRERVQISKNLGIKNFPVRTVGHLDQEQRRLLRLQLNCQRRHLSRQQRRDIIAGLLRASPELSNRWIASIVGVNHETVGVVRRDLERGGKIRHVIEFRGRDQKRYRLPIIPTETAAEALKASHVMSECPTIPGRVLDLDQARRIHRKHRREVLRSSQVPSVSDKAGIQLHVAPMSRLPVPRRQAQLVIGDPPYDRASLPLYSDLGVFAAKVLKPGGVLACYAVAESLNEVMRRLEDHLNYVWTVIIEFRTGGGISSKKIQRLYKATLLFSQGEYRPFDGLSDVLKGRPAEKADHEWEQPLPEVMYLVERLSRVSILL